MTRMHCYLHDAITGIESHDFWGNEKSPRILARDGEVLHLSVRYDGRVIAAALADLEEIFAYIAKDNRDAAARLVARFEQAAAQIAEQPYLGEATRGAVNGPAAPGQRLDRWGTRRSPLDQPACDVREGSWRSRGRVGAYSTRATINPNRSACSGAR